MPKKGSELKTVTIMMIITLFGKMLGLLRDSLVGSYFGTDSIEGAAFNFASTLPRNLLDFMFASAISASFIPVFSQALERDGKEKAFKISHNFISIILAASLAVTVLCIIFAEPIIMLYVGSNNEAAPLAVKYIRVLFPIILVSCLAFSLTGVLQTLGEFNLPAAMGLACNAAILFYYFFFMKKFGVYGLCFAYLAGWSAQLLIQLPYLWKRNFGFRFRINLKDEAIARIGRLMLPVMVSTWVAPVNALANGKAALFDIYGLESYNAIIYANTLYSVISGVFVLSVSNIMFPKLSALAAREDAGEFGAALSSCIRAMMYVMIPMALGIIAVSSPIVRFVYERGNFTSLSTRLTSSAMIFFSIGIPGFGIQTIMTRAFYAFQEGKAPMLSGFAAIAANAALSFALVPVLGVGGPALASSVSITLAALIMLAVMAGKVKGIFIGKMWADILKMAFAGAVMFICSVWTRDALTSALPDSLLSRMAAIGAPIACGCAAYIALTLIFRVDEALEAYNMLKTLVRKRWRK
ncbi:MAG: murein biosynthesis integral membrane protein MurJ [Clostridiales bacterium]|jgi:putative peptidoglycan lipid II flippase|nr:murein biosynthesis integral membrane protein MurJ [Clostridiales bacterium]